MATRPVWSGKSSTVNDGEAADDEQGGKLQKLRAVQNIQQ